MAIKEVAEDLEAVVVLEEAVVEDLEAVVSCSYT